MRLQLIPVRGRKPTTLLVDDDMLAAITTYPRKGTETPDLPEDQQHEDQLQLIPVRGRKLVDVLTNESGNQLQLIPARGRKPVRFHLAHDERLITTYPRKGTKKPLRAGMNQCGGALLFRFFCFRVSGRAFRRGWPRQREFPRCPAGRSASRGGSHSDRR